jgi:hypothetical protein
MAWLDLPVGVDGVDDEHRAEEDPEMLNPVAARQFQTLDEARYPTTW